MKKEAERAARAAARAAAAAAGVCHLPPHALAPHTRTCPIAIRTMRMSVAGREARIKKVSKCAARDAQLPSPPLPAPLPAMARDEPEPNPKVCDFILSVISV